MRGKVSYAGFIIAWNGLELLVTRSMPVDQIAAAQIVEHQGAAWHFGLGGAVTPIGASMPAGELSTQYRADRSVAAALRRGRTWLVLSLDDPSHESVELIEVHSVNDDYPAEPEWSLMDVTDNILTAGGYVWMIVITDGAAAEVTRLLER